MLYRTHNNSKLMHYRIHVIPVLFIILFAGNCSADDVLQMRKINNVSFEMQKCELNGKTIECFCYATSPDKDRTLNLMGFGNSKMYDDSGNEYLPLTLHIANKEGPNSHGIRAQLITGIRTKVRLVFENVSTNARTVSRLDYKGKLDNKPILVTFRNIPISK